MKKKRTNKSKKLKPKYNIFVSLFTILSSIFLIYQILLLGPIEPIIRYVIIFIIIGIDFIIFKKSFKKTKSIFITLCVFFSIINIVLGFGINYIYSLVDGVNKDRIVYSTSLITKNNGEILELDDVVNKKIGILDDVTSIENYILASDMIEENKLKDDNEIVKYDNLTSMLHDLYNGDIDLMFISSNYKSMFQGTEEYDNISNEVISIVDSEKSIKKEDSKSDYIKSDGKSITKPFTVLLMGVDSEVDGMIKNASNGDSLILLTFNPSTLNTTMLSIPRDSYVPIACFKNKGKSKLTHAGWYGSSCMIEPIEIFLDVNIDYYVKINFKGVVILVDTLGGVTVDVPKDLCTDDSNRVGKVCIKKGVNKLNGEEALVLARNRYNLARGDLDRGNNQQLLLKALLNEVTNISSVTQITDILSTISNNLDTNMTTNQILSLYNILKDIISAGRNNGKDIIAIQKLELVGDGKTLYDNYSKLNLWNYVLRDESIEEVSQAMQDNLGNNKLIKTFEYSINEKYIQKSIGK